MSLDQEAKSVNPSQFYREVSSIALTCEADIRKLKAEAAASIDNSIIEELQAIDTSDEPLLQDDPDMFIFKDTDQDEEIEQYKNHQHAYWIAEETSMSDDVKDWDNLIYDETSKYLTDEQRAANKDKNDKVRYFLEMLLAFFFAADGIVNANLIRFISEINKQSVKVYYTWQAAMEVIHGEAYAIMLKSLVRDTEKLKTLFRAIYNSPSIRQKAVFALKYLEHPDPNHYINSKNSLALRLVSAACTELIQFSSSFAGIYWIRAATNGKMVGLSEFNKQIARDEGLHGEHHCRLYNREIKHRLPVKVVYKVLTEAYEFEKNFFTVSLPVAMIGMNAGEMDTYVRMVVIRLSEMLGYPPIWAHVKNPFPFMDKININSRNNLHEVADANYKKEISSDLSSWGAKLNF